MLYRIGRFLQFVGLLVLPIAIAGNIAREDLIDLRTSLWLSGFGVALFFVGYGLQQVGRRS